MKSENQQKETKKWETFLMAVLFNQKKNKSYEVIWVEWNIDRNKTRILPCQKRKRVIFQCFSLFKAKRIQYVREDCYIQ